SVKPLRADDSFKKKAEARAEPPPAPSPIPTALNASEKYFLFWRIKQMGRNKLFLIYQNKGIIVVTEDLAFRRIVPLPLTPSRLLSPPGKRPVGPGMGACGQPVRAAGNQKEVKTHGVFGQTERLSAAGGGAEMGRHVPGLPGNGERAAPYRPARPRPHLSDDPGRRGGGVRRTSYLQIFQRRTLRVGGNHPNPGGRILSTRGGAAGRPQAVVAPDGTRQRWEIHDRFPAETRIGKVHPHRCRSRLRNQRVSHARGTPAPDSGRVKG